MPYSQDELKIVPFPVDLEKFWPYYRKWDYASHYQGNSVQKALEHYISIIVLDPRPVDLVIDIASSYSKFPQIIKEEFKCKVYKQDLSYPPGVKGDKIGGDAGKLPLPDSSVNKMTLHCAFEHFEGDADTRFIKEAERVLVPGGKVCILPLYLRSKYFILTDPYTDRDRTGLVFDEGAEIVEQKGWKNRFGRHYDVRHLKERVLNHCNRLKPTLYNFEKEIDEVHGYLKFMLVLEKQG